MMPILKYTSAQLLHLRDSPLVEKPAHLPAIEQWIDESHLQQQRQGNAATASRQQRPGPNDAPPMGNFSTGQRSSLMQSRSATRSGEDVSLGPSPATFASSRNFPRPKDFSDKSATPLAEAGLDEQPENQRSRFFGDKHGQRKSMNDTDGRHSRDSWAEARQRRAQQICDDEKPEGADRGGKYGRRDREQEAERRNGHGDHRWGARDDRRQNGERQGGWRDRDRQRQERDWERGRMDKEPEWMEEPVSKQEDDLNVMTQPKNQEEFEKWKQEQHARNKKSAEESQAVRAEPPPAQKEAMPNKLAAAPLKLEGGMGGPFAGLGEFKRVQSTTESVPSLAKSASKQSKFMHMFKKDESKEDIPAETATHRAPMESFMDTTEDKAGFDRILQMLSGTNLGQGVTMPAQPPSSPPGQGYNSAKTKSRFTGFFDQAPKSPERMQSPPSGNTGPFRPLHGEILHSSQAAQDAQGMSADTGSMFGPKFPENRASEQIARTEVRANVMSPESAIPLNGSQDQHRSQSGRMTDDFLDQPPSRGGGTPHINIQNLLAQQHQRQQGQADKQSEFLLNLMRGPPRPSSQQAPHADSNFPLWIEPPPTMPETQAPKPRAPAPPGLFEDQLLRNHQQELQRAEQQSVPGTDMPQRRQSQRAAPGFFDEQTLFLQQQQQHRRNFTEPAQQPLPPSRRMSAHPNAALQTQISQQPPQFPPDAFLQSPTGHQQVPPPGFNPHMPRHPPGIGNAPNIFMAPQPQQQQREPPGFGGLGGGMVQQTTSPPNPPPGFFGGPQGMPPGFMQMRSPTDNRGFSAFDALGQRR